MTKVTVFLFEVYCHHELLHIIITGGKKLTQNDLQLLNKEIMAGLSNKKEKTEATIQ